MQYVQVTGILTHQMVERLPASKVEAVGPDVANTLFAQLPYLQITSSTLKSNLPKNMWQMIGFRSLFQHIYRHEGFVVRVGTSTILYFE